MPLCPYIYKTTKYAKDTYLVFQYKIPCLFQLDFARLRLLNFWRKHKFRPGNPVLQTRTRWGRAVTFTTYFLPVLQEDPYLQSSYWTHLQNYNTSRNQRVCRVEMYIGWKLIFDSARSKLKFSELFVEVLAGELLITYLWVSWRRVLAHVRKSVLICPAVIQNIWRPHG